jgi:hypothetical protein
VKLAAARRHLPAITAAALVVADALARLLAGGPYTGATFVLLAACGVSLLPFLPLALATPSLRLSILPALALGSYAALLTTMSIVGIPLTELSIRLGVALLVAALGIAATILPPPERSPDEPNASETRDRRREGLAIAALLGMFVFAAASSWDLVDPLQARGTDWGHYLLYADEVDAQQRLLIDDPLAGEDDRVFADPPAVGAVYGSFLILDGISSWTLGLGLAVVSGLAVLSTYAGAGALWGVAAGLAAASAYAVAPIRFDLMYWHGLGTALALVFVVPLVASLGLVYRGRRDWRTSALLAVSLVGVAASHSTSAIVMALLLVVAALVDAVRHLVAHHGSAAPAPRSWWRSGIARPVVVAVVIAAVVGAGVGVHLQRQLAGLGRPVDYRLLGPKWLGFDTVVGYYTWAFVAFSAAGLLLVLSARRLRRDPALLAVAALAIASVLASQLWVIRFAFPYGRFVYYLGVAMVLVIGVGFQRLKGGGWLAVAGYAVVLAYFAHLSVGLRFPERVLSSPEPRTAAVSALESFRRRLDSGQLPDARFLVTDSCLHFSVPYLVRRPTLPAFFEGQVGFENRLPLARKAARILEGGPGGRRLAESLGVRYVVADPRCTPDVATRLGATVVVRNDELVVARLS